MNPKCCQLPVLAIMMEIQKNGKNRLQTNARPSGAIPRNRRSPGTKSRMQKPQGRGKVLVQIPGGARGMAMDEIDTCISQKCCLGTSTESFTGSSTSEQITVRYSTIKV